MAPNVTTPVGLETTTAVSSNIATLTSVLLENIPVAAAVLGSDLRYQSVNQRWLDLFDCSLSTLLNDRHNSPCPEITQHWHRVVQQCQAGQSVSWYEVRSLPSQALSTHWQWQAKPWKLPMSEDSAEMTTGILLLLNPVDESDPSVYSSHLWRVDCLEQVVHAIAAKIHQSNTLETILQTAVQEICQSLSTSRVLIYKFHADWSGTIVTEAVEPNRPTLTGQLIHDPCFGEKYTHAYQQGRIHVVDDTTSAHLQPCYIEFLRSLNIRANLVVPILENGALWGLLCVQECKEPRQWQPHEITFIKRIVVHLGIAIQQSNLRSQLQQQIDDREAILELEISQRLQKELALRISETRRSLLFQQTPIVVIEVDCDFKITAWNPAAKRLFGYDESEALGRYLTELIVPDCDRASVQQIMTPVIQDTCYVSSINQNVTKDGRTVVCEWYNTSLIDEMGQIIGAASMAIDITERQRAEAALQASERELREQTRQLEEAFSILTKTQAQLVQTEKMSSLGQLVAGVAHEINNPVNFIYGNLAHAQDYANDLINLLQLYDQHYPQPVPVIEQFKQDIELNFLIDDFPKTIASMKVGSERIRQIVQELRNFSRLDESEMKSVDIHQGLDSTLMLLQYRLKGKGNCADIQIVKNYGQLPQVDCYAGQINQVFMNILANAIDALADRGDRHEIDANPSTDLGQSSQKTICITTHQINQTTVRIDIADNGMGIPPRIQHRLFDPFFTTKPPGQGTGLGLSISYQIVVGKHGGQLYCHSTPGEGTHFIIEIPILPRR